MQSSYIDAAILLKVTSAKSCIPVKFFPDEIHTDPQIETIMTNSLVKCKTELIFCYTLDTRIAFAYSFKLKDEYYSISIITTYHYPKLYEIFYLEMSQNFKGSEHEMTAEEMFDVMTNTLPTWVNFQMERLQEVDIKSMYEYLSTTADFFSDYDPYLYFENFNTVNSAWKALLKGTGLLVVADTPDLLMKAAFAALCIISPLKFQGNFIISVCDFDWRLDDLDQYEVVCVLPNALKYINRKFKIALKAQDLAFDFSGSREKLLEKSTKFKELLIYLMDRVLTLNPFNDILEGPYVNDSLEKEMNPSKHRGSLLPPEIRIAEKTSTIKKWRKSIIFRDSFRDSFLSSEPSNVVSSFSLHHVKELSSILDEIDERFKDDTHIRAVVKKYRKEIASYLEAYK